METDHIQRIADSQLKELEEKYKRVKLVIYNGHELVFRKPLRTEIKQHRIKNGGDSAEEKAAADEQLAQLTLVHLDGQEEPVQTRKAFLALLDEWPYLCANKDVGRALSILSGVIQEETVKTLGPSSTPSAAAQKPTARA